MILRTTRQHRAAIGRCLLLTLIALALLCGAARRVLNAQTRPADEGAATAEIKRLIAKYAEAVDRADTNLASQVWSNSADISFIHPVGHEYGWEEVKRFYTNTMEA